MRSSFLICSSSAYRSHVNTRCKWGAGLYSTVVGLQLYQQSDQRRYLGEGLGAGWTDERLLSSVSPLMVLQMRLVFKGLHTDRQVRQADKWDRRTDGTGK